MKLSFLTKIITAFAAIFILAMPAAAQSVLVVDQARVMRESNVGKHIASQLKSIGSQMDSEKRALEAPMKSEATSLEASVKGLTREQVAQRPDLKTRAEALAKKQGEYQVEMAYKQRELAITEQKAVAKVNETLSKVLEEIVKERGATLMVDRSMVMYAGPTVDVTDDVIRRMNTRMSTVSVVRERLPRTQQ